MEEYYKSLPPGLARRLEYSRFLIERRIERPTTFPTFTIPKYTYFDFLISKNVFENTIVSISKTFNFCPICQFNINPLDITRTLSCKHVYHIDCVDRWLTEHDICPGCRQHI